MLAAKENDPMKLVRMLLCAAFLTPSWPALAAEDESPAVGHALVLVHLFVRLAAESETPAQNRQAIDDVLAGRNAAANEAATGLMKEMLVDVPAEHRATLYAIGRDLAVLARRNLSKNLPAER